ncbi:o-succinylbenzoate synthase [Sulfobacillus thermosulfidooxidans]|uniref:o-succinylbenzoate synthase n=1 Tax=Sulfobacillus thermosulfidooxidans TaxID=28034 RepID=UPI00096B914C|nr:o-succinylbenzoate synthase [Sulfobacillus thermosulfidooxidans]OLZ10878.1 o-succinylbenzoate synthase [Sulfobacillus thermosulfidooxidans]OLZ14366.1 o-succinylbenzoate synthase [Sulfobacillus thermosulfidooxidans]OLZ19109.1 o-succinylbenzoate synthase [Sulfobacillus thermosulfidooxidans]
MRLEEIQLQFISLPLKTPFATSFGREDTKRAWIITVRGEGIEGYAESVASDLPLYSEETHASVYYAIRDAIIPHLQGHITDPQEISLRLQSIRGNRMAKAAVEMAIWDWFAKSERQPLYRLLGGREVDRIPVGVSIGIQDTLEQLGAVAEGYWKQGYRRLKIKIRPGWDVIPLRMLRARLGDEVPIMADANSAYRLADRDHFKEFEDLHLMMIEQPLAYDDIVDHATLAKTLSTPICLDESIHSVDDARKAWELGALGIINLKVGRVGGYAPSLAIEAFARQHHIPLWCGGMLETGIGRAHNLHLTTLAGFTLPGDTSASDRYFWQDIITEPFALNADGTLTVPTGFGIGVDLDPKRMQEVCTYEETWKIPVGQDDHLNPHMKINRERRFPELDLGR